MDYDNIETYQKIDSEIEKLRTIANTFGKNISTETMRPHQLSVFVDLDKYFRATIYFNFSLRGPFPTAYYLAFQQRRNADGLYGTIYPKRHLVPEQVLNLGKYHSGHYYISKGDSISEAGNAVINMVSNLTSELLTMCRKSTPWYNEEKMNETLKEWRTEAKIVGISKEMPIRHMVTGIKASQQSFYDSCYGCHGSNGTYVENANPEWVLKVRLRRLDFAVDESWTMNIDIHRYITHKLMPSLEWGKISAKRLEDINNSIKNRTVQVFTHNMDEALCYRDFLPIDYSGWEDFLDSVLLNS